MRALYLAPPRTKKKTVGGVRLCRESKRKEGIDRCLRLFEEGEALASSADRTGQIERQRIGRALCGFRLEQEDRSAIVGRGDNAACTGSVKMDLRIRLEAVGAKVCNPAIQFTLYEAMLKKLKKIRASNMKGAEGVTALEIFLLGALAKLGATVATYPLLVVKSRLQAKEGLHIDKRHRYQGTWDAITKMIRYEGIFQFYKGMGTKIVQSVFAAAVLFMIKEELVKMTRLLLTRDLARSNASRLKPSRR